MYLLDGRNRDPEAVAIAVGRLRDAGRRQRAQHPTARGPALSAALVAGVGAGATGAAVAIVHAGPALAGVSPIGVRFTPAPRRASAGRATSRSRSTTVPTRSRRPRSSRRSTRSAGAPPSSCSVTWRRRAPGLVAEVAAAGHEVAVHGDEHRNMLRRMPGAARDDIRRCRDTIAELRRRRARVVPSAVRDPVVRRAARRPRRRAHDGAVDDLGARLAPRGDARDRRRRRDAPLRRRRHRAAARLRLRVVPRVVEVDGRRVAPPRRRVRRPRPQAGPLGDHGLRGAPAPAPGPTADDVVGAGDGVARHRPAVAGGFTYACRGRPPAARRRRSSRPSSRCRRSCSSRSSAGRSGCSASRSTSARTASRRRRWGSARWSPSGPLLVSGLLFALPLATFGHRRARHEPRDGAGGARDGRAGACSSWSGRPRGARRRRRRSAGSLAGSFVAVLAGGSTLAGRRAIGGRRALLLGVATGTLYGLTSVLTKSTVDLFDDGIAADLRALAAVRARGVLDRRDSS